jgi:hypothetical protein
MNTNRFLLFLIGCIGTRSLFVYLAKTVSKPILAYMGYVALLIGIGFFTIYFTGSRKTGPEVFGDKIWWNDLRPFYGAIYLLFAIYAIQGKQDIAWKILLADVTIGLVSFLMFHYKNGDFNVLKGYNGTKQKI